MIRPYQWILANAEFLGVKPENINAASADLCLGRHIIERREGHEDRHYMLEEGEEFLFLPNAFYIAHSEEYTRVPFDHAWMLALKSSTGRKGLNHLHAGWGDPGFEGQVTFEFQPHMPVPFKRGQRIVQLIYMALSEATERPYGMDGRYQGQRDAQMALPDGRKYGDDKAPLFDEPGVVPLFDTSNSPAEQIKTLFADRSWDPGDVMHFSDGRLAQAAAEESRADLESRLSEHRFRGVGAGGSGRSKEKDDAGFLNVQEAIENHEKFKAALAHKVEALRAKDDLLTTTAPDGKKVHAEDYKPQSDSEYEAYTDHE